MTKHPPVYQGNEPYIFVSYAHRDSDQVIPIIERLQQWGFRVWYDAGIEAGTEWPEYIASHLRDSYAVIAFISAAATQSPHCRQEITYAGAKRKDVLAIYLDDAQLPAGLELQLGNNQSMFLNRAESFDGFMERLIVAELIRPCCAQPAALPLATQPVYKAPPVPPQPLPRCKRTPPPAPVKNKKSVFPKVLIACIVLAVLVAGGIAAAYHFDLLSVFASPEKRYQQAMTYISQGAYYDAYTILEKLGDFEDSQIQLSAIKEKALIQKISTSKKGDTVIWGSYEQNNDRLDGSEPIEWVILHSEEGRILLISKYGLDRRKYHEELEGVSWADSDLRAWLNDEFLYDAFTNAEQSYLFETTTVTLGSVDCLDKVFLLSEEEAELYQSLIPTLKVSEYAIHQGAREREPYWWLRSPWDAYGSPNMEYANVCYSDNSSITMYHVDTTQIAVRPCIWIETRSEETLEDAYNSALALFSAGQYKRALTAFKNLGGYKDSAQYVQRLPKLIQMQPFMEAEVGDEIKLGSYTFIVLEKQSDKVLIISKYAVEEADYHSYSLSEATWKECTLREWLNGTFINSWLGASDGEKSLILFTEVVTGNNPEYGTTGGEPTTDRVFILSYEEIMKYFPEASDRVLYDQSRQSTPVPWWTRTKGKSGDRAIWVDQNGTVDLIGDYIFQIGSTLYVRPALWIDISE